MPVVARFDQTLQAYAAGAVALRSVYGKGGVKLWPPAHAAEPTAFTTPGAHPYTLPAWFRLGIDFLDAIGVSGGGSGGIGSSGGGQTGSSSTVTIDGAVITLGAGGSGGASGNPGGGLSAARAAAEGSAAGNETYLDETYIGGAAKACVETAFISQPAGNPPGGGGPGAYAVFFTPLFGFGGHAGSWGTHTAQPTSPTITVNVGDGGAAVDGGGGTKSGAGAPGAVTLIARQNIS